MKAGYVSRGIPTEFETAILEQAGKNRSTREIAVWLAETHGVSVSHATVGKFLRETRIERADIAKNVLREKLSGSLLTDIERLEHYAKECASLADKNKKNPKVFVLLVEQLRKITETKLHYSGADESDDDKIVLQWSDSSTSQSHLDDAEPVE